MKDHRSTFLRELADAVPLPSPTGPSILVGIDGVDGAGKTVLADQLAGALRDRTRVERISIDGFHRVRAERYRRGRHSAEGFWRDSYDYAAFHREVVRPFLADEGTFLRATHDVDTDDLLDGPREAVVAGSLVIVDGIFLHRPELRDAWDFTIFLDVPFRESARRMATRDGLPADPAAPENARYVGGQRIYLEQCDPRGAADLVVDYGDLSRPSIRR
ncbi:nucleoside/nucleotide kinase family protein [Microbacterium galbinum]|uniref:Uridine kinase n=1 Tax=Microbacterium galbinum TaxID=2851646 RepID=A0ABY4IRG1_9MICO|nr:uridine kinase [Microbacterium galbinum]UPL14496.1 uridine kinase [Microbacterium galbinum]